MKYENYHRNNKLERFKAKADEKLQQAKVVGKKMWDWSKAHPKETIFMIYSAARIGMGINHAIQKREEQKEFERRVWDPVAGQYYHTRKPMNTRQKLEFDRRVSNGERRGEVLEDMRILNRKG